MTPTVGALDGVEPRESPAASRARPSTPTIGVLGGGQLGRMLALAGLPLGVRFQFFDPNPEAPAGQVAPLSVGEFDDAEALAKFAAGVDVVTYEFENVPVAAARNLATKAPVFPPPPALHHAQDRLFEKTLFENLHVPVTPFAAVDGRETLDAAVAKVGLPAILKTRRLGYDGKGQYLIRDSRDVDDAWRALAGAPLILEQFIPFQRELSIIAVRGRTGATAFYPMTENAHRSGILHTSKAPAANVEKLQPLAEARARAVMESLDYVGVLAIEFFQVGDELLANEMAPRVHNSGHWTIEGAATSQFANHVRAILGYPLGACDALGPAAMLNLIGCERPGPEILALPGVCLHWYGKSPRPGRKVGHVTVAHVGPEQTEATLRQLSERYASK